MTSSGPPRRARVAEAMKQNLAEMIQREIKDPRIAAAGLVMVNHVELNRDMSVAQVFVSFAAGQESAVDEAMRRLARAGGALRGPLARRMNLKRAPELRFVHDTSLDLEERIAAAVREDEDK